MSRILRTACACLMVLPGIAAHAALIDQGQTVYDTDLNVSWLKDANLAFSLPLGLSGATAILGDGTMPWQTAQTWLARLNSAHYLGYSDWRLPTTLQPDSSCSTQTGGISLGYGCSGSELGHLFYAELGGVAGTSLATTHNANYSLFSNIGGLYWSGTALSNGNVWNIDYRTGLQYATAPGGAFAFDTVWAVRNGVTSAVPAPPAAALFGSGLAAMLGLLRRRVQGPWVAMR